MLQNRANSASKFWAHVSVGVGGQPSISFSDVIDVCPLKVGSKHGENLSTCHLVLRHLVVSCFETESVPDTLTKIW